MSTECFPFLDSVPTPPHIPRTPTAAQRHSTPVIPSLAFFSTLVDPPRPASVNAEKKKDPGRRNPQNRQIPHPICKPCAVPSFAPCSLHLPTDPIASFHSPGRSLPRVQAMVPNMRDAEFASGATLADLTSMGDGSQRFTQRFVCASNVTFGAENT